MEKKNSIINENDLLTNEGEIDFKVIFQFLLRNKRFIALISFLFFAGAFLFSFNMKKVWQGQFQIVASPKKEEGLNLINPRFQALLKGSGANNDLQTQIGILESPSVLMPIFEYVKNQKKIIDSKSDISFSKWKKNFKIDLQRNTSILDVEYKDTDKQLILPVLSKISSTYQEYSGKNEQSKLLLVKNYLINQISYFKIKSFNSLKVAQDYAIDQNLYILDSPIQKKSFFEEGMGEEDNLNLLIPNIALENIRVNAANEIKRIDSQLEKILELGDDYEKLQYIGSTIPGLVKEGLPAELAAIEKDLIEKRSKYKDNDPVIIRDLEKRILTIKLLKNRAVGYLEAKKIELQATMEAALRPKDVLLKYKEMIREASRDETTLINLENQLRLLELEKAKQEEPWKLITDPTLLNYAVAPSRSKVALMGLFIGLIGSSLFAYIRENKLGKIYDIETLENLFSINTVEKFLEKEEFKNEKINFMKAFINKQSGTSINFICLSESQLSFVGRLRKKLIELNVNKEIIVFESLEKFKNLSSGNKLLFVDISTIKKSDVIYTSKYLNVLEVDVEGLIVIHNM